MSVYAEWHWQCALCDDHSEEPFGDEYAAAKEEADHLSEAHPDHLSEAHL